MTPCRSALLGLAGSLIFVVSWFWRAGMEAGMACLFVSGMLVLDMIWLSGKYRLQWIFSAL